MGNLVSTIYSPLRVISLFVKYFEYRRLQTSLYCYYHAITYLQYKKNVLVYWNHCQNQYELGNLVSTIYRPLRVFSLCVKYVESRRQKQLYLVTMMQSHIHNTKIVLVYWNHCKNQYELGNLVSIIYRPLRVISLCVKYFESRRLQTSLYCYYHAITY